MSKKSDENLTKHEKPARKCTFGIIYIIFIHSEMNIPRDNEAIIIVVIIIIIVSLQIQF